MTQRSVRLLLLLLFEESCVSASYLLAGLVRRQPASHNYDGKDPLNQWIGNREAAPSPTLCPCSFIPTGPSSLIASSLYSRPFWQYDSIINEPQLPALLLRALNKARCSEWDELEQSSHCGPLLSPSNMLDRFGLLEVHQCPSYSCADPLNQNAKQAGFWVLFPHIRVKPRGK